MGLPSSSRLVAADSIWNCAAKPAFSTKSFITNSAIGLRQIFPWQIKRIFFISRCLPNYYLCVQYSKRAVINQNFAEKKNSAFRQNIRKTESIQFGTASYLSSSISSMLIFKGSTPTGSLTKSTPFLKYSARGSFSIKYSTNSSKLSGISGLMYSQ